MERRAEGTQMFENIIVFENYPLDKSLENGVAGIKINNLRAFERTNFPLTVLISPGESLRIHIAYEIDKFSKQTVDQLLSNFETVLRNIISGPSRKLSELSLLTDAEKYKILIEWNNSRHEFPSDKCVHDLIQEQVSKTPDAIAVEFGNKKLTYKELDERSNQVANYLQRLGVKINDMVGICVDRSIEMVIFLLGILKSGAALFQSTQVFQPRILFMLKDTNAPIVITQSSILENFHQEIHNMFLLTKMPVRSQ
jgi:non-ribosomal peptide synthetase component F